MHAQILHSAAVEVLFIAVLLQDRFLIIISVYFFKITVTFKQIYSYLIFFIIANLIFYSLWSCMLPFDIFAMQNVNYCNNSLKQIN